MERSTVASLLRSTQGFCQQICEKQTFDFGIAFWSERFAAVPDANQIREVILDEPGRIAESYEQATAWFASRGLKCFRWSPAVGVATEPLSAFLTARGHVPRVLHTLHLSEWREGESSPDVRVLPARAVRELFRQTFTNAAEPAAEGDKELLADSFLERLDDPQLDMFVATVDKKSAGRCGLYQVGDIARIVDLFVLPEFAGFKVAETLLAHVLAMAKRLTMPMVVVQALHADFDRLGLLRSAGFQVDGQVIEYEIPSSFSQVAPV